MKAHYKFGVFLLLTAMTLFGMQAFGQETTGSISGNVMDQSGAVIPDVTVTVTNQETGQKSTALSGELGNYMALELRPGRYSVSFTAQGFARKEIRDVVVLLGRTSKLDAELEVGGIEETVTVTTATALIDTQSTMVSLNIPSEEFDQLPKGRSFQDLASFQTSVNTGEIEAGFQVNGASAAENNYYIDGASTTSVIDGSARQNAYLEYVQEVQVKTSGLEAEYGGAMGGVISAVTKSGGNEFHGEIHYYLYGNRLNTSPTKRLELSGDDETVTYFNDKKQQRDYHEIGGTLSGPIIRDKLWFFSSLAPQWYKASYGYHFADGDANLRRDAHRMSWFNKLSWDPTSRIRTNFTYLYSPQYLTGSLPAYDGWGPNQSTSDLASVEGYRTRGYDQPENSWTGSIDFTLTNASILSVKGGRYYLNFKEVGIPYDSYWWYQTSALEGDTDLDLPDDVRFDAGYQTPSAARIFYDVTTRTYVQADYSHHLNFGGEHNFKLGVGVQKNVNNVNDQWVGALGRVLIYWGTPEEQPGPFVDEETGIYGYYEVDDAETTGSAGATITHIYFQDSWRIHPRLTLNLGLRTEREVIPAFNKEVAREFLGSDYAIKFGFRDKLAPRLGASLDVFGDGRLKVSGGWGRYFDWTKYDLPRGSFGGDKWVTYYRALDTTDVFSINLDNMPGANLVPDGEYIDWRGTDFELLDPDIKPMSLDRLNFGVDYEVRPNVVFAARYSRSKLNRTIEDIGVLDASGSETYSYGNPGEGANKIGFVTGETCEVVTEGNCGFYMPKAERVYNAFEISLSRRFGGGWLGNVSYVYSDLHGNYSGLQNTDEIRPPTLGYGFATNQVFSATNYRPGGNVNRYFDLDEAMFDAYGNAGVFGPLPTDRPHVFKLYGSKQFSFGTDIGLFFRVMSGTPVTTQVWTNHRIPMFVEGRGDKGRTPVFSQTDLLLAHKINVGEGKKVQFEFNFENLFNQKTATFLFDRYNREELYRTAGIRVGNEDLSQGFDWQARIADRLAVEPATLDPRYGMKAIFNPGFSGRFLVKYTF